MDFATELVKEGVGIALPAYPASLNNTNLVTGPIDMSKFYRCSMFGVVGTTTTSGVQAYLQESANQNMVGATNIAGAVITNINNTANQAFTIECNVSQLKATSRYVAGTIAENLGHAGIMCAIMLGFGPRYHPEGADDASVNQRVVSTN